MQKHTRYWEIDVLRGIAIILMVLYHFRFDLSLLGFGLDFPVGGWWQWLIWSVASLFLLLVGVSLWLAQYKSDQRLIRRGLTILGMGVVISLVTFLFASDSFVRFGILHLIGVSILLSLPFFRQQNSTKMLLLIIWAGWFVLWITTKFQVACGQCGPLPFLVDWLMMLFGFWPPEWQTLDYYPLLPWWGVVVAGVFVGQLLYPAGQRKYTLPACQKTVCQGLALLGRHSLAIYLLHQPILLLLLTLFQNQFLQ